MAKREYEEVKRNVKENYKKYDDRLNELNEKELYAMKIAKMFEQRLAEIRQNPPGEQNVLVTKSVKRLFVGAQELVERCKVERTTVCRTNTGFYVLNK